MAVTENPPSGLSGANGAMHDQRARYHRAFDRFSRGLRADARAALNGAAKPDWQGTRSFALPVDPESGAYRQDDEAAALVRSALEELILDNPHALLVIALWLQDRAGISLGGGASDRERIGVARICGAKNARLEAHLVGLAIGLSLHGNSNGYAIAAHFGLKPQTIHEMLGETCEALGVPKPLSKSNTKGYANTQYRHHVRSRSA